VNDPVDVEPRGYDAASAVFGHDVHDALSNANHTLHAALAGCGAMAGNDPGGTAWAHSYDTAARTTLATMIDLQTASVKLAAMLQQTGFNHGAADTASNPKNLRPTPTDKTRYVPQRATVPDLPSAAGGSGGGPPGWSLIQDAVGYVWPNGDVDKLTTAATAWSTAADALNATVSFIPEAVRCVLDQHSPEVDDAFAVCDGMGGHVDDVADNCRTLSQGCSDLAGHIRTAHDDIEHELVSLLEWTAGIEAAGALVGFFTVGIGEGAAQGVEATRIAATASRVSGIIGHLSEMAATVTRSISVVVGRLESIAQRLKAILGVRVTEVTTEAASTAPALARDAETLATEGLADAAETHAADDALYQQYVERKTAAGKTPRSREAWQNMVDALRRNKAVGDGYRDEVADQLGIQYGEAGWDKEITISQYDRRYDIANPSAKEAFEVKSGSSPTEETLTQLAKDEKALRAGWQITWQLKTDLNPTLMARLRELTDKYPGFHYTVKGG
jgi:hypothetical protein